MTPVERDEEVAELERELDELDELKNDTGERTHEYLVRRRGAVANRLSQLRQAQPHRVLAVEIGLYESMTEYVYGTGGSVRVLDVLDGLIDEGWTPKRLFLSALWRAHSGFNYISIDLLDLAPQGADDLLARVAFGEELLRRSEEKRLSAAQVFLAGLTALGIDTAFPLRERTIVAWTDRADGTFCVTDVLLTDAERETLQGRLTGLSGRGELSFHIGERNKTTLRDVEEMLDGFDRE